jgi:hypothetical protein
LTLGGAGTNAVATQYPWPVVHDVILAGRLFSALCGALTAPLVFLIARRLQLGRWDVLAAVLAALAPGHVQQSHFATVDVPATFFVTLCLYLSLRAATSKGFLAAGLVAGLAAGTKYNAGLVLLAPLVALWWPSRELGNSNRKALPLSLGLIAVALLGFLLSTPYALLSPREFWGDPVQQSGFSYELFVHPREGSGDIFKGTGNGWIYHFTFNLPFVLTWPLIAAALVGIYFAAKKREFWPSLAFLGLFFVSLGFSQVRFMRYLLPLVPGLCLLAAYGASQLRFSKAWGALVAAVALVGCSNVLSPLLQKDPRDQAKAFVGASPSPIALEEEPWFWTPPFFPNDRTSTPPGVSSGYVVLKSDPTPLKGETAPATIVESEIFARERERLGIPTEFDKALRDLYPTRRNFKNSVPLALPGRDFVPHDYLYTNPETRVYSRR